MEEEKIKFDIREKIAIKLLIVFMNILKPTKWSHDLSNELKEIKDLVDKN